MYSSSNQPYCYINSLPGLVPTTNSNKISSILKEDGKIVQSVTNLPPNDSFNGAGFNGTSIKSTKMYTDPDGSVNIHIDGPTVIEEAEAPVDPWSSSSYKLFISKENAREKLVVYDHTGPISSFGKSVNDLVRNPILYSELDSTSSRASLYLKISTDQLLLARGTYVVRLYRTNSQGNYTLFKVFTLTAKSDPIQGPKINERYLNTMNRLGIHGGINNIKFYSDWNKSQNSSIQPTFINDLYLKSETSDTYYRLGTEISEGEPVLFLLEVEAPTNNDSVIVINDMILRNEEENASYKLTAIEDLGDPSTTEDDTPVLTLTKV